MQTELLQELQYLLGEENILTLPKALETFSKDQYDFSPILKTLLGDKRAEVVVIPTTIAQVNQVVDWCVQHNIPLTVRGAGSGNYGQAVPLKGGVVLSTHKLGRILEINPKEQWARVEPGVKMGVLEREARKHGLELRIYPSTWATATIAGFLAGGFAGVGSVQYGTLWDGLLLEAEVLPMLRGARLQKLEGNRGFGVLHAYGTTGIVCEIKLALAPARQWEESIFTFPDFLNATAFATLLGQDLSIHKRELSIYESPIEDYFLPLKAAGAVQQGAAHVFVEVEDGQSKKLEVRAAQHQGKLHWHNPSGQYHKGGLVLSDYTWNHTTLWAIKSDPSISYTQARFDINRLPEQIKEIKDHFGDEVLLHLEYIREQLDQGGVLAVASPVLLRYQSEKRVQEIHDYFEKVGVQISDPHTYYLDGDARWAGQLVLNAAREFDPKQLLNPGKIRALEQGRQHVQAGDWFSTVVNNS